MKITRMENYFSPGGKTILGREFREWSEGMVSNVKGRKCILLRFKRDRERSRVLVRWLSPWNGSGLQRAENRTQWVGRYEIDPRISIG